MIDAPKKPHSGLGYKWHVMLVVSIGVFMSTLDSSIISVSLPTLTDYFNTDIPTIEWVILAYLLAITTLLLTFGRLSDMYGRKNIFSIGIFIFTIGSGLCSISITVDQLIAFRVLQGIGAAMIMANGPAIITDVFPFAERGKALGLMGAVVSVGLMAGPALGGFLIDLSGWQSIFYINIPIGIFGTAYAIRILKSDGKNTKQNNSKIWNVQAKQSTQKFDILGAVFMFIGITALLLAITRGQELGWYSSEIIGLFILSIAFILWFLVVEYKFEHRTNHNNTQPLVELSLFKNLPFSASNISSFLSFMAMFAVTLLMPYYMENILDYSPKYVGMALISIPLIMALVAPVSGWMADRTNSYALSSLGMVITCIALYFLATLGPDSSFSDIALRLSIVGLGMGLFHSPNNSIIMGSVPKDRLGIAGGLMAMMRNLGMVTGIAIAGTVFTRSFQLQQASGATYETAFMAGFHNAFIVAAIICAVGILTSLVRGNKGHIVS